MKTLVSVGPFEGVCYSKDPAYLDPGMAAQALNVDPSFSLGSFSSAYGRTLLGTLGIPAGYTVQGIVQFNTFFGDKPVVAKRLYVFSSVNATGTASYQGYFDPSNGTTTQLPNANPFTFAVQFGASIWTNGGDRILFLSGQMVSDVWQISISPAYSFNLFGTYATTAGNAPADTYTYAVTLRKAQNPWPTSGSAPTTFTPDMESFQESSPLFTTTVTTASGQQPGFYINGAVGDLPLFIQGLTRGGQQYYGCLYRSRLGNPTFTFVDYIANLTQMNDHSGNASIIDTYSDAQIANNAFLTIHHDVPPFLGLTYPGAIANNSSPSALTQQNQSTSFSYANPGFLTKHKGRVWCFTLYPAQAIGSTPPLAIDELTLQPQVWCSDFGVPWSFNADSAQNQVLLVGPEDTPGNGSIDNNINLNAPWAPGLLEDSPMQIASTGSYLVMFKSGRVFIGLGDTPSEFIVQDAFDVGCISSRSVTPALGGLFWLAPEGVYFFNGGTPEYVSEDVRGFIESVPWAQQQTACGGYRDRTFYLSFAQQNTTLAYYIPTKKWYTLPYGASLFVSSPYNQNALIGVSGNQLHFYNAAASSDLGQPVVSTWTGNVTNSGAKGQLKQYRWLKIMAPTQPGLCTVTLTLDALAKITNTYSVTVDLSKGNGEHIIGLPGAMQGYEAQLTIQATSVITDPTPVTIREVVVEGDVSTGTQAPQTTDIVSATLNGQVTYPVFGS